MDIINPANTTEALEVQVFEMLAETEVVAGIR
jgi:hypothetical protein